MSCRHQSMYIVYNIAQALAIRLKSQGPEHPQTAMSYNNIGAAYAHQLQFDRAIEYYHKALQIRITSLGANHPTTAATYNNIGNAYEAKGDLIKAVESTRHALDVFKSALGADHPDTRRVQSNLDRLMDEMNNHNNEYNF